MNKLETLKPGDAVWHLEDGQPRMYEYVARYGATEIEVRRLSDTLYLDQSHCYAVRAECYAMAAWKALDNVKEQLEILEKHLAVMAEAIVTT